MLAIFEFAKNHVDEIIAIMGQIVLVASAICALTPSAKDDGIVAKARKVVEFLALNVGHAVKK